MIVDGSTSTLSADRVPNFSYLSPEVYKLTELTHLGIICIFTSVIIFHLAEKALRPCCILKKYWRSDIKLLCFIRPKQSLLDLSQF